MSITSPVSHHTNVRRRVAAAAAVLVALMSGAACSAGATEPSVVTASASSPAEPRPSATVDELVGADGSRLHVRCVGHGDTTVLLIAGFGDGGRWDKIEPSISGQARVCSYARPGTGTSDPPSSTQTFTSQANDLRSLLHAIGEPGPYVVVGHSFGGAEAVTFASLFPEDVAGLLLLDATPTTWIDASCAVPPDGSETARNFQAICAGAADPALNPERLDAITGFADVAGISSLDAVPMTVVTAAEHTYPDLAPNEAARLNQVWDQGQDRWTTLSPLARLVSVPHTGHDIQLDHPDVVIQEIATLLNSSGEQHNGG
jgi:pimeloyl-ACP methyl ester carboxylesterase